MLRELLPRARLCPHCPVPLPRAPRRARGGDAWLLSRRCFQRPPLHSNTAMGWGGRSSTPQPCSPPWSRGVCPRFAPKRGENQRQQLSATTLRLLHPDPNTWGRPRQPRLQYLSAHSVLAADNRGDKTEGHTDGQTSEVYSFSWSTRALVLQDGAEPQAWCLGRMLTATSSPHVSRSPLLPRCVPRTGGILRWPRAPQLLLVKCVGGQRAELVPALRVCPSPVARGKVLGATLRPCPTAQCWQHRGRLWAGGSVKATGERSGAGAVLCHRGRGPWSPATSGVSSGLWVPFVDIQSLRKAWVALRCARRWVMEKPALPSSWERITSTCLWRKRGLSAPPRGESQLSPTPRLCLGPAPLQCHHLLPQADPLLPPLPTPHLCRGGTLSCVLRLPRVETTLKLSVQSHWTCR